MNKQRTQMQDIKQVYAGSVLGTELSSTITRKQGKEKLPMAVRRPEDEAREE